MTHTPGPWIALRCEFGWHIGPQPDGVCSIQDNSNGFQHDRQAANARLIAASPDLLAACEMTELALEDCRRRLGYPTSQIAHCVMNLRIAIGKAKAKEPAP